MGPIIPFFIAIGLSVAVRQLFSPNTWVAWLVALNIVTFFTYGYDKRIAGSQNRRIPESTLLGLALLGGTPLAIVGMYWFHHKTAKTSFKRKLRLVIIFQIAVFILFWFRVVPRF